MNFPLSQNELIILDRQMAMVAHHLSEIASLLGSRLGDTAETAACARMIAEDFAGLARKIHNQTVQTAPDPSWIGKSHSA